MKFLIIICFSILSILLVGCSEIGLVIFDEEDGHVRNITPVIPEEDNFKPEVYFCPKDNCSKVMLELIENASSVHCALFDLDLPELISAFDSFKGDLKVVVDRDNVLDEEYDSSWIRYDNNNQLSHNKFCVIDNKIVTTGSFNPTINGNTKNNNNLLVIYSKYLAQNYDSEFLELWAGVFGRGSKNQYNTIILNEHELNNYFCPDDGCEEHVLDLLYDAESSIYFMVFSFTSDPIGDLIIDKHKAGAEVKGVLEKSQNSKYNEYSKFLEADMNVSWDTKNDKGKLHHKVFIIDEKIVITGSYNPTSSGDNKNDENIVVIRDDEIVKKYLHEFYSII